MEEDIGLILELKGWELVKEICLCMIKKSKAKNMKANFRRSDSRKYELVKIEGNLVPLCDQFWYLELAIDQIEGVSRGICVGLISRSSE